MSDINNKNGTNRKNTYMGREYKFSIGDTVEVYRPKTTARAMVLAKGVFISEGTDFLIVVFYKNHKAIYSEKFVFIYDQISNIIKISHTKMVLIEKLLLLPYLVLT